jgi:paraquat-inducible protein B
MPIKWSALQVNQAMDEVELQLKSAQPFIDEVMSIVNRAKQLPNLPQYMTERLVALEVNLDRFYRINIYIKNVRNAIPKDDLEAEQKNGVQGSQLNLI